FPVPAAFRWRRWCRNVVAGYSALALTTVFILCVVDFYFFQEFGERLNHKAVHYLQYGYVFRIVLDQFPVIPASLAAGAVAWLFYRASRHWGASEEEETVADWRAVLGTLLTGASLVLSIRGSVGPKPINTGPAYFNASVPLTQLALNGGFTLRETLISLFEKQEDLGKYYSLSSAEKALKITREVLAGPRDRFLNDPANPLRRITDSGIRQDNYNVVLVILESLSWPYIGAMGGDPDLTPNLSAIAEQGFLFDRCFAVGKRTTRGFSGIVAGFPDLPGDSVTTRSQSEEGFLTLGTVLQRRGYETMFIYGGQPYYDHRQAFLGRNGYGRFVFEDEFVSRTYRTHLGWSDEDLFNTAHAVFSSAETGRPFFATLLTLSFHRPYGIPEGRVTATDSTRRFSGQIDAIRYVDWSIGRFMEKARQSEYFESTIFVFVADHMGGFKEDPSTIASFRIPFIIYAPAILGREGKRISTVCSQTDVAPTIMALLGGRYEHSFFGSSVIDRPPERSMALVQSSDLDLYLVDGEANIVSIPPYHAPRHLFRYRAPDKLIPVNQSVPENRALAHDLSRKAVGILQTAEILFRRGSYRLGASMARIMARSASYR
ncbi:MAG: LTA synthase family protein, partial [Pseudomonadota bacterium]